MPQQGEFMTGDQDLLEGVLGNETRRSFVRKSAVATAGAAAASGIASAQEEGDDDDSGALDENWKALSFVDNLHPNARFAIVSDVVEWVPSYGDVRDNWFTDFNTRMIRWHNTGEVVPLYVAEEANIGQYGPDQGYITDADDDQDQPQLFEMDKEWTPFGDNERLINVSPVGEDTEDRLLDLDDWWQDVTDGD